VANPKYGAWRARPGGAVLVEPEFPEIEAATLRSKIPISPSRAPGNLLSAPVYAPGFIQRVIDPTAVIGTGRTLGLRGIVPE